MLVGPYAQLLIHARFTYEESTLVESVRVQFHHSEAAPLQVVLQNGFFLGFLATTLLAVRIVVSALESMSEVVCHHKLVGTPEIHHANEGVEWDLNR